MNQRNLNEGQWEDRKQWSLGVGQHRKTFWNRYIHTYSNYIVRNTSSLYRQTLTVVITPRTVLFQVWMFQKPDLNSDIRAGDCNVIRVIVGNAGSGNCPSRWATCHINVDCCVTKQNKLPLSDVISLP
jgi:hypothetical protein